MSPGDPAYPEKLRALPRPPDPLWVDGELPDRDTRTVGIVGTRRLTPYGARAAREVALAVGAAGAVVVSGLAQGIDSVAHEATLEAGGATVAVLGEGLLAFDTSGPLLRRRLAARIRDRGAIVSEFALDTSATRGTFPRRNATIAALSDVLVVVEAPERSGALITAGYAVELRRPIYAVPGPIGEATWAGSHDLLLKGIAGLLTDAVQLVKALGLGSGATRERTADRLLELLACGAADADAIAAGLDVPPADVPALIARHLVAGTIAPTGDGRFARR